MRIITNKIVKNLKLPKPTSHKGDNGRLLIIAGSKQYHGALLYCIKAASRIVDLIYIVTTKENQKLISKLKGQTAEFIPVTRGFRKGKKILFDCVLIGPGLGKSIVTKKLVSQVLFSGKQAVFDADALKVLDEQLKKLLNEQHILTPHHKEFMRLFGLKGSVENTKKMAKKYHCHIVLKGPIDVIAEPNGKISLNKTGNAGMTKGGTGDVLAGLIAAFYTTNNAFTSAAAGCFVNGDAGDYLHTKVGPFYNAEDLLEQIPKTLNHILRAEPRWR